MMPELKLISLKVQSLSESVVCRGGSYQHYDEKTTTVTTTTKKINLGIEHLRSCYFQIMRLANRKKQTNRNKRNELISQDEGAFIGIKKHTCDGILKDKHTKMLTLVISI